jgi:hypothetical protein
MATPTHRYRAFFALAVALACVATAWRLSSPAGAAPPNARGNDRFVCSGSLRWGPGVTRIAVKAEKKKDEDSWLHRPTPEAPSVFTWSTEGGYLRGCSNAITFAVANARGDQALVGITLGQSFRAGANGGTPVAGDRTSECQILAATPTNAHFICRRYWESLKDGKLVGDWSISSP